ncbi:MAG: hypothetical protein RR894_15990 [Terrisporobacter sp.]
MIKQRSRASYLYKDSKYNFDDITNVYFLVMIYNKLIEIKNYPSGELMPIFGMIKNNLYLFNYNDTRLSLDAVEIFNYIKNGQYELALKLIKKLN